MDNMDELRKEVMNNIEELTEDLMNGTLPKVEVVIHMYAIGIGTLVAAFLLNTGRGLKIIQLCKECLILLHNEELKKEKQFFKLPFKIASYHLIFRAYCLIADHTNAVKYGKRLLVIYRELGETPRERSLTMELANIYVRRYKYVEARELYKTAISIMRGTSNRKGETITYGKLGHISFRLSEYAQAIEYHEKALAVSVEIGDREGEATAFSNLGAVFQSLSKSVQAKEYLEKALTISVDIGNRKGEATVLGNLGDVFKLLGQYVKAIEYHEKALAINMEIGDREGEASDYEKLGLVFIPLGELAKAKEYFEKAIAIRKEIGGREGEASSYLNQATVFETLGKYLQAKEYHEKALAIKMEIGDRAGVASSYVNLGTVLKPLGEYIQAKGYCEKALVIYTDIGHREGEASAYTELGLVFGFLGDQVMAEGYLEKALSIYKDIEAAYLECCVCFTMAAVKLFLYKFEEAYYYLSRSISKSEDLQGFLEDNDQLKISFSDFQVLPYKALSIQFIFFSNDPNVALCVLDLGRARALADLMAAQYSVEKQIYAAPQSWIGIENIMKKESNCICLYISYHLQNVLLWIIRTSGVIQFQFETVCGSNTRAELVTDELDEFFTKSFRHFEILPEESCEDRSLNDIKSKTNSPQEENLSELRLVEEDDEGYQNPETLFYKMLIAPVADLLVEPEIIIVPERNLYQIPFSALRDEDGKYLSETFRIRIVPSLTTLKLIKDSPADYHSQTGALIVGDPVVGWVLYKGSAEKLKPLPCARKEAEMIGRLLGIQPLLGEHATKQAVLELIHSVSLIHFAAHGNSERGEIALSPLRATDSIPEEEEYLLTMSDISQVQLRAKLVVLSCCHSGSGQIRAEGVIGIARAFLGSGARSVLVALWALEDSATEQLMRCFYKHLVRGESASECLHEAMKWMR